ncbi:MAG: T9SS type A sorting domain-containing protein [Bacteroidota bacterium]
MKRFGFFLLLLGHLFSLPAQMATNLQLIPAQPVVGDSLYFAFTLHTGTQGFYHGTSVWQEVNTGLISATACVFAGPLQQPDSFRDTIFVGMATLDPFRLELSVRRTWQTDTCTIYNVTFSTQFEQEIFPSNFSLFPNPVSGEEVSLLSVVPVTEVHLFDSKGRWIQSESFASAQQISFPVAHLSSGHYVLRIKVETGEERSQQLLILP